MKIATQAAGKSACGIGTEVIVGDGSLMQNASVLLVGTGTCLTIGRDGMAEIEEGIVTVNGNTNAIATDENERRQLRRPGRRNRRRI